MAWTDARRASGFLHSPRSISLPAVEAPALIPRVRPGQAQTVAGPWELERPEGEPKAVAGELEAREEERDSTAVEVMRPRALPAFVPEPHRLKATRAHHQHRPPKAFMPSALGEAI